MRRTNGQTVDEVLGISDAERRGLDLESARLMCGLSRGMSQALTGGAGVAFLSLLIFTPPVRREAHGVVLITFTLIEIASIFALVQCLRLWSEGAGEPFRPAYLWFLALPGITILVGVQELIVPGPRHYWPVTYPTSAWWAGVVLAALTGIIGSALATVTGLIEGEITEAIAGLSSDSATGTQNAVRRYQDRLSHFHRRSNDCGGNC